IWPRQESSLTQILAGAGIVENLYSEKASPPTLRFQSHAFPFIEIVPVEFRACTQEFEDEQTYRIITERNLDLLSNLVVVHSR
ncbi:MAG: hypothetical protein PXY39_13390, partial [archaeon]|nr:hypothetical protein [archaeon]